MLEFFKRLKETATLTVTENGARTYTTTGSDCLNLFSRIGGLRQAPAARIAALTERAFAENADLTLRILFFARDVRGGLGERRVFRIAMQALCRTNSAAVCKNLTLFPQYGRWDDLIALYGATDCPQAVKAEIVRLIRAQLSADSAQMAAEGSVSLLAKWLPSVNTSSDESRRIARTLARKLGMQERDYRKTLSALRRYIDILENRMRERDYTFDYGAQPSRAMFCHRKAFYRNDGARYRAFLEQVKAGRATLHTDGLYPYDIVRRALQTDSPAEREALDVSWNALRAVECNRNAIAVVDGSGSMYTPCGSPRPFEAALSLGLYFADHCKGAFANHFITFSAHPRLVEVKGRDIVERAQYAASFNECSNTNLQAVFDLILTTAVQSHLPQEELPETVYIISDMEFDVCVMDGVFHFTNFDAAKKKFARAGYRLPEVVFWNVAARNDQSPVQMHESGAALVSGASPALFEMVRGGDLDPYGMMLDILSAPRYAEICA